MFTQCHIPPGQSFSKLAVLLGAIVVSPFAHADAGTNPDPITTSAELYELENLLKIEIFMEDDDWDKVRFSWRGEDQREVDGRWVTIESDYEHQPGDIVINGVRVENVGIRKKGFYGSLSSQRPALKVKFNKYVKGQKFLGIKDLTLNNNKSDATQIRQYLSYKWFRRAGLVAPRCNLARVYINGKYLGVYSNVEPMGKAFVKRNFGSSGGTLYEGTAVDFQPRAVERFEAKTHKKSHDKSSLKDIARLLEDVDTADMDELGRLVDLDQFMKFWIAEMMLGHWDGYAGNRNNFFVYQNSDTGRLEFLPWGTDGSFGHNLFIVEETPKIIHAKGRLCAAIYANPKYRQRYLDMVADQLSDWWDGPALLADLERAAGFVRPHVQLRERDFDEALMELREYIVAVKPKIAAELKTPPDQWLVALPKEGPPGKSESPSWAGTVKSDFLVPFGRYDLADMSPLKQGSLEITWRGKPLDFPAVVGKAGYKHSDPRWFEGSRLLLVLVSPTEGHNVWISMTLDQDLLAGGKDIKLHKSQVVCWFGTSTTDKPGQFTIHGGLDGVLRVELVDVDGVKHIKGTIDANLASSRKKLAF